MLSNFRPLIRDIVARLLFVSGLTKPSYGLKTHPFLVVTFHRVLPLKLLKSYPFQGLAVTPDEFSWFIKLFKHYFICATLAENFCRWTMDEPTNKPLLSITFDDGQLDNFIYAEPLLAKANIPATFFVVTNSVEYNDSLWHDRLAYAVFKLCKHNRNTFLNCLRELNINVKGNPYDMSISIVKQAKTLSAEERLNWINHFESAAGGLSRPDWDGMMGWRQLAELINRGHEIGSHSMSHPILPLCNETQLSDEIVQSRNILENRLDAPITSFCYPNGSKNNLVNNLVKQAGYNQAVTTKWGANKSDDFSPFLLNRYDIQGRTSRSRDGVLSESRLLWRLSPFIPMR